MVCYVCYVFVCDCVCVCDVIVVCVWLVDVCVCVCACWLVKCVFDVIVGQREGKNDFVCVSKEREAPRFPIPTVNCVLVAFTLKRIIMARTRSGI